jgi:hypothetical protein
MTGCAAPSAFEGDFVSSAEVEELSVIAPGELATEAFGATASD